MPKYIFDVPCNASLAVEAATEEEARAKATDHLAGADLSIENDNGAGCVFSMSPDSESDIELIDTQDD